MALSIRHVASPTHRSLSGPLGRLRPVFQIRAACATRAMSRLRLRDGPA